MRKGLVWIAFSLIFGWTTTASFAQDTFDDEAMTEESEVGEPSEETDDGEQAENLEDLVEEEEQNEEPLKTYQRTGRRVYLICIYGDHDEGIVTRKCRQVEDELNAAYGSRWVTRVNNPDEAQLRRIEARVGHDIATIMVVTHSTPDPTAPGGYDVWDCDMEPEDFADIFEDHWVIWNGCFSVGICEKADNIIPTQCVDGVLPAADDTWREIMKCLERNGSRPLDRDDICEEIFGEQWPPEEE
jgi:hypothetical protein